MVRHFLLRQVNLDPFLLNDESEDMAARLTALEKIMAPTTLRSSYAVVNDVLSNSHLTYRNGAILAKRSLTERSLSAKI